MMYLCATNCLSLVSNSITTIALKRSITIENNYNCNNNNVNNNTTNKVFSNRGQWQVERFPRVVDDIFEAQKVIKEYLFRLAWA